jgi:putative acetyltransferase
MRICVGELDRPDVQALLALHVAEMRAATPADYCHVMPGDGLRDAAITFLSARGDDGGLLGIGALKRLSATTGEVKSMRVHPLAVRRGVARGLLDALEAEARAQGMTSVRLETGTAALFDPAIALYRAAGYTETGAFEGYLPGPYNLFFEKAV